MIRTYDFSALAGVVDDWQHLSGFVVPCVEDAAHDIELESSRFRLLPDAAGGPGVYYSGPTQGWSSHFTPGLSTAGAPASLTYDLEAEVYIRSERMLMFTIGNMLVSASDDGVTVSLFRLNSGGRVAEWGWTPPRDTWGTLRFTVVPGFDPETGDDVIYLELRWNGAVVGSKMHPARDLRAYDFGTRPARVSVLGAYNARGYVRSFAWASGELLRDVDEDGGGISWWWLLAVAGGAYTAKRAREAWQEADDATASGQLHNAGGAASPFVVQRRY